MKKLTIALCILSSLIALSCSSPPQNAPHDETTHDPKTFSRSVCLMGEPKDAGWQELGTPPLIADELKAKAYTPYMLKNPDPTEIWYEAPNRLLVCSSAGAALCGHTTYIFKRENNEWKNEGGTITFCDIRKR